MKKLFVLFTMAVLMSFSAITAWAAGGPDVSTAPTLNQGKKWRIAYVESGPYINYAGTLYYLLKGLESRGWVKGVDKIPFARGQNDTKEMWSQIALQENFSTYIDFLEDGYYSLKSIPGQEQDVLKRFSEKKDADLLIVMGTVAGKLMANDSVQSNVTVFSISNALKSGIVKGAEFSGRPRVWSHMDPFRYKQQLQVFHDIFKFKKLGVVYEDSPNGKSFAAVDDIEAVSKEKRFEVVRRLVPGAKNYEDQERYLKDLLQAHQELAEEVDGFYYAISPAPGLRPEHLYTALRPLYDKKIPVFAQFNDEEVNRGALLSIARADFGGIGQFGAEQIVKMLNGATADSLPQIYSDTPNIALNLQVAKQIGYKPTFEILLVSDKIFLTVAVPEPTPPPPPPAPVPAGKPGVGASLGIKQTPTLAPKAPVAATAPKK